MYIIQVYKTRNKKSKRPNYRVFVHCDDRIIESHFTHWNKDSALDYAKQKQKAYDAKFLDDFTHFFSAL